MIPCFVISLPDCSDRRQSISQTLNKLGISFEFLDAVDGRSGLDPTYESQVDRKAAQQHEKNGGGGLPSDAEFACALSHINTYRRIVAEDIPYALVLEDDASPLPTILDFLNGEHYRDADLTQLDLRYPTFVRKGGVKHLFANHSSYLRAPFMSAYGTCAYVISKHGASFLANNAFPVSQVADWPDCIEKLIANRQFRCVHPLLVKHDFVCSLIGQAGQTGWKSHKENHRFLGIYIPPFQRQIRSLQKLPYKLFSKRLVNHH